MSTKFIWTEKAEQRAKEKGLEVRKAGAIAMFGHEELQDGPTARAWLAKGYVMQVRKTIVKAMLANGDFLLTNFNGTEEEAKAYYVGNIFNVGAAEDNMQECIGIEFH